MKIGRPRKYKSKVVVIGASIPEELNAMIEDFAYNFRCYKSEAIVLLLQSADSEIAKSMLDYLKADIKIRKEASNNKVRNIRDVYSKFEIDSELEEFVMKYKKDYNILKLKNIEYVNAYTERIFVEYADFLLGEGKVINRRNYVKLQIGYIIKGWLKELD